MSERRGVEQPARAVTFVALFADQAAFEAWYRSAMPVVFGFVHGRSGGDVALAEDITAEAFLEAVRARASFDGRSDPLTWVCSIARNRLIDHYRTAARERSRHLRLVEEDVRTARLDEADDVERRDAVVAVMASVPPLERTALFLRYVDGYSVTEMASMIGRSVPATESILSRARERVRRAFPGGVG